MRIDDTISYPGADAERVFAMLRDPEFQREKCAATGATSYDVDIHPSGDRTVITCRRTLPTDGLPDFVRPFTSGGLVLVETIDWSAADGDGARIGAVRLAFTGQPLSMSGELDLRSADTGTTAVLAAELVATVPLLGGRIEKACEPLVHKALRTEESLGREWLARGR
jgi:Protein of unknown function (DUF2505)